jgi:hypothetical protein
MARQQQDEVDLPALWRARQKIQEIIQAGLERKKMTRRRIARYLTNGKPTRDWAASHEPEVEIVDPEEEQQLPPAPAPNGAALFTLDQKPKPGWEIVERGLAGSDHKEKTETDQ